MSDGRKSESPAGRARRVRQALQLYEGPLVRYARRITGDLERARDVVQDAFLRLWRTSDPPDDGRLGPWLFAVCRNRAIDVRRKESRMNAQDDSDRAAVAANDPPPHDAVERQETQGRVALLLEALPASQQEVIRLKFQNGFTYRQIADITGRSVNHVGVLIHTAIKTLRDQLIPGPQA